MYKCVYEQTRVNVVSRSVWKAAFDIVIDALIQVHYFGLGSFVAPDSVS